jgi:hypothetical protein
MSKAIEFIKSLGVPESVISALESADDTRFTKRVKAQAMPKPPLP